MSTSSSQEHEEVMNKFRSFNKSLSSGRSPSSKKESSKKDVHRYSMYMQSRDRTWISRNLPIHQKGSEDSTE